MASISQLQIITTTDGDGDNCHHRTLATMALFPQLRAVIGTLHLRGCRDLRSGARIPWAKPWAHHIWLIEPDGGHYDPSACNLAHWAQVQEMELPRPWQQMTATVMADKSEQGRLVGQIVSGRPALAALPDAVYLPGLVYSSDVEEIPASPAYVTAWGHLAVESVKAGGWDVAQLDEALSRVDELMASPPRIRSTALPISRAKTPRLCGKGFGR